MDTYHGGTWDNKRHFHKYRNNVNTKYANNYYNPHNVRGHNSTASSSTLNSNYYPPSSNSALYKTTPTQQQNIWFEQVIDPELPRRPRRVSCSAWISFATQIICAVSVLFIFLSPGWGRTRENESNDPHLKANLYGVYGMWLTCYWPVLERHKRFCVSTPRITDLPSWWIVVQVLACIFLVLTFISLLLICFYVFRIKSNRKWTLSLSHSICSIFNCLALATCIVVFAVNFKDNSWWCCPKDHRIIESILYWAWYLAIVALLSQLIALAMTIAETCKLRT